MLTSAKLLKTLANLQIFITNYHKIPYKRSNYLYYYICVLPQIHRKHLCINK